VNAPKRGYVGVFTGHHYAEARPIGNADYRPRAGRAELLDACHAVLAVLAADNLVPVGPRAVGYRLIGKTIAGRRIVKDKREHPKPERAGLTDFGDVSAVVNRARRAGLIPWSWVSDARADSSQPFVLSGVKAWAQGARALLDEAEPDVLADQPLRVEVWTEAVDLMALAAKIVAAYGVPCFSASGWGGPVPAREAALRWTSDERPLRVLYIGDLDPDGLEIAERQIADAAAFTDAMGGADVSVARVAVTETQVAAWTMPHEPGPKTSHRNGITVPVVAQAEAIPPAELRELLTTELEAVLDLDAIDATRRRWAEECERIDELLTGLDV
jgi:hypothetical protein